MLSTPWRRARKLWDLQLALIGGSVLVTWVLAFGLGVWTASH